MSKISNGLKPLGVKQLLGQGASRLPTFQRREAARQNGSKRQALARDQKMNKHRNLDQSAASNHSDTGATKEHRELSEDQKKQELMERLKEFKAQKAKQRLEEMRTKRKPFVVGSANATTPQPLPKTPSTVSKLFTPKRTPFFGSGLQNQSRIPTKRAIVPAVTAGSKILAPGFQRARPNLTSKEPQKSAPTPLGHPVASTRTSAVPANAVEAVADDRGLSDTYEVIHDDRANGGGENGVDAENEAQDQDAANATIIIEARGEDNGIPLVENALSDDLQPADGLMGNTTTNAEDNWMPKSASSPEHGVQCRTVTKNGSSDVCGETSVFTFNLPSPEIIPPADPTEKTETRSPSIGLKETMNASYTQRGDTVPRHTEDAAFATPRQDDQEESGNGVKNASAGGSTLRRSTRATRFTGSFKALFSATPRHRRSSGGFTKVLDKPAITPLTALIFDDNGEAVPGIMEVRTPDSLPPMSASLDSLADQSVLDGMESLRLTTVNASEHQTISTWSSIDVSDNDEDDADDFFTARSPSSASQSGCLSLDRTFNASDLSTSFGNAPEVIFNDPPVTPGSILRKEVGASTQKKTVRFRNKVALSPIYFEHDSPTVPETPVTDIVRSFGRRQSTMPGTSTKSEDMIDWSP